MTTETETKLTGHIATACKAIQKQIDKYYERILVLQGKAQAATNEIEALRSEIAGLEEQISKLKGQ